MTREEEIRDLKAKAYDLVAGIQSAQVALQQANARIAELMSTPEQKPEKGKK